MWLLGEWGGVLDRDGNYVEESGVYRAFGGKYEYSDEDVEELNEEVIHINIIPKHWGHFLVDVVSRLWYVIESNNSCKITYCGWKLDEKGLGGNYLEFFEKLGIAKERLIYVRKPLHVRKAVIPDRTFEYSGRYHEKYQQTVQKLIDNILQKHHDENTTFPEKVYLTRTQLKKSKYYDTGEKELEDAFRRNGFSIIASERLSLYKQVMLLQNAKIVAALSGTLPHNIIFTNESTEFVILNRTNAVLPPQIGFNNLFNRRTVYIDAFHESVMRDSVSHGDGPFWIECNENVSRWFKDNNYPYHNISSKKPIVFLRNYISYKSLKLARQIIRTIRR